MDSHSTRQAEAPAVPAAAAADEAAADEMPPRVTLAHDQARDELRRAGAKATTLLSLVGAVAAGVIALNLQDMSTVATVVLWCAAAPILTSVLVLLTAIRPRLPAPTRGTWLDAVHNGPEALLAAERLTAQIVADDVCVVGRIALRKYRRIAAAVWLLLAGLALLVTALVLVALT